MTTIVRSTIGIFGAALLAAQLLGAPSAGTISIRGPGGLFDETMPLTTAQKEVEGLFQQIASNAAITARHAAKLEAFARPGLHLQSSTHAIELMGAKDAINSMNSDLERLNELNSSALPWQQTVIERLGPIQAGLAGNATDAIVRLKEDRRDHRSGEYRNALKNLYAYAGQARDLVSANLDYAEAREKLDRLDAPMEPAAALAPVKAAKSLDQRVRSELLKLPYYGVFDYLAFSVDGGEVTLSGHVSWPVLKADAERFVRGIDGVETVNSTIEVLPVSSSDDQLRLAAYRAIYGHSTLAAYRLNPHPPIRIIVNNGNLTLHGVVGNEMHRTIANIQANSVPGAFSVTNHLQIGS